MQVKIYFQDRLLLNAGQNYCRILKRAHSAMLPFAIKAFVLSLYDHYTNFTRYYCFNHISHFMKIWYLSHMHKITYKLALIFGNEKLLRYSWVFVIIKFHINNFEIQCNIGKMIGNGWSLPYIRDEQVRYSGIGLYFWPALSDNWSSKPFLVFLFEWPL